MKFEHFDEYYDNINWTILNKLTASKPSFIQSSSLWNYDWYIMIIFYARIDDFSILTELILNFRIILN
jgi:hypothetical protein